MPVQSEYAVVIVTHEHALTLDACLEAVARLVPVPTEVVVVDNASADASAEIAAKWAGRLPLTVERRERNDGFAAAANRGIEASATPWVLSLNPDCAPRPGFVGRLLAAARDCREEAEIGALTGRLVRGAGARLEPEGVLDAAGIIVTPSGRHFDRGAGEPDDDRHRRPAWVFGGSGAATLYRRRALDDVAYPGAEVFAESFFAYREDAELAWRLQWRGWRCLYAADAVAVHGRGFRPEAGRHGHALVNAASVRNRFLLRWHCADLVWHLRCFPWWLVRDLLVVGACLTVERSSLRAFGELWRGRREARRRRRWVLGRRLVAPGRVARHFRRRGWAEEV